MHYEIATPDGDKFTGAIEVGDLKNVLVESELRGGGEAFGLWATRHTKARGPFRTQNPKTSEKNCQYENCSHFWDID